MESLDLCLRFGERVCEFSPSSPTFVAARILVISLLRPFTSLRFLGTFSSSSAPKIKTSPVAVLCWAAFGFSFPLLVQSFIAFCSTSFFKLNLILS